jgi:hypothetical protein
VKNEFSYPLNGADRFQVFFDEAARRKTGIGNVIRAHVTVSGIISAEDLELKIAHQDFFFRIASLMLKKKWYSPLLYLKGSGHVDWKKVLTVHHGTDPAASIASALRKDCFFNGSAPVHIDVVYEGQRSHIIISASHIIMDYAGMENLIASMAWNDKVNLKSEAKIISKSFLKKISDAFQSTIFVARLSGWNLTRLARNTGAGKPLLEKLELTEQETAGINTRREYEIRTNALSFFLGCAMYSIRQVKGLLSHSKTNYFVAVPVERRSPAYKKDLLSNHLSFLYFGAAEAEIINVKEVSQAVSRQMISQAKKNLPEKFSSLMQLFRFVPSQLYKAFINLPSNGHSGTFAFSLLGNSCLENKSFMGFPVEDVTHYAPVISPPGLNIVFTQFHGRLKIILSFDESRITRDDARALLAAIKDNLLH